jgi:hypothetical protein
VKVVTAGVRSVLLEAAMSNGIFQRASGIERPLREVPVVIAVEESRRVEPG